MALALAVLAFSSLASADIRYLVHPDLEAAVLQITMEIPVKGASLAVQMPRWAPGAYVYGDYGKNVTDLIAKDAKGNSLTVNHPDLSTWEITAPPRNGDVTVTYSVKADYADGVLHYSGPETYLYVVGRTQEKCVLSLDLPAGWPIAIGLGPDGKAQNEYSARTYDILADNPVSAGKYYADHYTLQGKEHYIALSGTPDDVAAIDKAKLHKVTKYISAMESNFWAGEPYDHYVWHFTSFRRADGGGGLEHLASTQIRLATGFGKNTDSVLAHELFHAWNVKRIRPLPLGPFDYQHLPRTGALWWLEGVTDYYADTLLRRYGWTDDPRYYYVIARNVFVERANDQRFQVSPYDSSYRVSDAEGGRGNSNGFGVSYYNTGWLVGLCFDMAIRERTSGKRSLDDVARNLFKKYGHGQPGFREDGIRQELVNVGGNSLGDMYDQIVMKPGELPVEDALAKVGLRLYQKDETYVKVGFGTTFNRQLNTRTVTSPEAWTNLKEGDVLLGINGKMFKDASREESQALQGLITSAVAGTPIHLTVQREGSPEPLQIDVIPVDATRKTWAVDENPQATSEQVARREAWLTPPPSWIPPGD